MDGNRPKIWYDYLKWLLKKVDFNKKEWYKLMKMLHDMPFEWTEEVPMDRNRALDGIFLREEFFNEMGVIRGDFEYPCSIIEMLVALTIRMSGEIISPYGYDGCIHLDYIFSFFMRSLDLNPDSSEEKVYENVRIFVLREYENDGIGSLFPLQNFKIGYNFTEIWKQMRIFLTENDIKNVEEM